MAFNWNFRPARIPGMLQGPDVNEELARQATIQQAAENMQGYRPNPQGGQFTVPNDMHGGFAQPDLNGYGESLQAASDAAAKEQEIANIQNDITILEKRIAENTAKLKNFAGNVDQIAAIEARKINTADPTSIWRWKVDRDEARRIAQAEKDKNNQLAKNNALYEIQNELASIIVDDKMDSSTRNAHLSKLASLKTLAQKNGLDTADIDKKIKEVRGDGGEQTSREKAQTDWKGLKGKLDLTSNEIQIALDNPDMNWDPDERKEAENLRDKLKKQEAASQSSKNMKNWLLSNYGIDYNKLDSDEQKSWQEIWKAQK